MHLGSEMNKVRERRLLDYVVSCLRTAQEARHPREYEWYRNLMYYAGFQDVEPDPITGRPVPMSRMAHNGRTKNPKVRSAVWKYVSKLVAADPIPRVEPRSNNWQDRDVAKVANQLLIYMWERTGAYKVRQAAALDAAIFGNGFIKTQWNLELGDYTEVQTGEDVFSVPQTDDRGEPVLVDRPMEQVRTPRMMRYRHGMMETSHTPTMDIFPHPAAKDLTPDKCAYYFDRKILLRHQIKARFPNASVDALTAYKRSTDAFLWSDIDTVMGYDFGRYSFDLSGGASSNAPVEVWDMYHAPVVDKTSKLDFPDGFRLIFAGDEVLEVIEELPFHSYPHAMFRDKMFPGRFWGTSLVDDLVAKQDVLNQLEDALAEVASKIARPPLITSYGAKDSGFRGQAGEAYEMDYGEIEPHGMKMSEPPGMIGELLAKTDSDIERLSMVGAPSGGAIPERGSSGASWDILRDEMATTMTMTTKDMEGAWSMAAQMGLLLLKDHLPIPYVFEVSGPDNRLDVAEFDARSLTATRCRIVPGSMRFTYPHEKATRLMQAASNGMIPPEQAAQALAAFLGESYAAVFSEIDEPGERSLTRSNVGRILQGLQPHFGDWVDHGKCLEVLRRMMTTEWFFDLSLTTQDNLKDLLHMHMAALRPDVLSDQNQPQAGPGQVGAGGGAPQEQRGTAQVPASQNGYTGPLGPGEQNPLRVIRGRR